MFQSLSGLTLGLNFLTTGLAAALLLLFQSLSGLTLGLNLGRVFPESEHKSSFNPFQG